MTQEQKTLTYALADMVAQHCHEEKGVYDTGCITTNKEALILLCDLGVMKEEYPEKDYRNSWTRWFYASFIPGWELKVRGGLACTPPA